MIDFNRILMFIGWILFIFLAIRLIVSFVNYIWIYLVRRELNKYCKNKMFPDNNKDAATSNYISEYSANSVSHGAESPFPRWSILIPARNEENSIGKLLEDIITIEDKPCEVIVYDDNSTDRTREIVLEFKQRIPGLRIIDGELPDGWLGKNNGCHKLAMEAKGEYILFLDADVRIDQNLAKKYLNYSISQKLSLLSIFPMQILENRAAKISTPIMNWILLSLLPLPLVKNCSWKSFSAANGQFMLFKTDDYKDLNPHEKFRMSRAEDIEISRYFKKERKRIATLTGDSSIRCFMYNNLNDAINGFSKNVFYFFGNSPIITIIFAILTTLTPLWLSLFNGAIAGLVSIGMIILMRVFVSLSSKQSVFENLLYLVYQQFVFLRIIGKAAANRKKRVEIWKGRNIY
jgi:glycosyltransferase involved in cell wall biosynthesis